MSIERENNFVVDDAFMCGKFHGEPWRLLWESDSLCFLHGSEARPHPTGNGHCVGAATAAGITQNPENVTFMNVTKEKKAKEEMI